MLYTCLFASFSCVFVSFIKQATATNAFHNAPRFGHTNDFTSVFSEENYPADQVDYAAGLLLGGIVILTWFLMWTLFLLVSKCLGPSCAGDLFSGQPFQVEDANDKLSASATNKRPAAMGHSIVRVIFLTAGTIFIIFTFVLATMGLSQLQITADTLENSNRDVDRILQEADNISSTLRDLGHTGRELRTGLAVFFLANETFCPDYPPLQQNSGFDFSAGAIDVMEQLGALGDFIESDLYDVQQGVAIGRTNSADFDQNLSSIDLNRWQSLVIVIPFSILAAIMLQAMMLGWFAVTPSAIYTWFISWMVVPLFALATVFAYAVCSFTMLTAVANAGRF